MCFHCFVPHVSLCKLSGIPFCRETCSPIAAATVRSSASMQSRDIRIAVQIMVFYCGKISIGAIVSYSTLSFITQHSHRIALHVANASFFEHEFLVVECRTNNFLLRLWADFPSQFLGRHRVTTELQFLQDRNSARWLQKVAGQDGSKVWRQIF